MTRRFFTALPIVDDVADALKLMQGGIEGARWTAHADFHVTLTFIGEADDETLAQIDDALCGVRATAFDFSLAGTGSFAQGDWPNVLWVGVEAPPALAVLKQQIDNKFRAAGLPYETRKYSPHVTMARLRHAENADIARFMQAHNLYRSAVMRADYFTLYESLPGQKTGATDQRYVPIADYPLFPA